MRAHPARHKLGSARRQRGIISVLVLFMLLGLVAMSFLSISVGQVELARGQLQVAADSAAKSALRTSGTLFEQKINAQSVASQITALEPGVLLSDIDINFGDFDPRSRNFRAGGFELAPAVRVAARRTDSAPGGPLQLVLGFSGDRRIDAQANSIASTSCREIVFALDYSAGMTQEIEAAYTMIQEFVDYARAVPRSGDKIGITVYAGDGLSQREYATNGGRFWLGSTPEELSRIPGDALELTTWENAMTSEGKTCPAGLSQQRRVPMPTLDVGTCLGKGDHHGILQAIEMFDELDERCSAEDKRLIVLITSDIPCAWPGALVRARTLLVGGTLKQAFNAADEAADNGIAIQPILLNLGSDENCPVGGFFGWQHSQSKTEFAHNLARGFVDPRPMGSSRAGDGRALINPIQDDVNALFDDLTNRIPVLLVE